MESEFCNFFRLKLKVKYNAWAPPRDVYKITLVEEPLYIGYSKQPSVKYFFIKRCHVS